MNTLGKFIYAFGIVTIGVTLVLCVIGTGREAVLDVIHKNYDGAIFPALVFGMSVAFIGWILTVLPRTRR